MQELREKIDYRHILVECGFLTNHVEGELASHPGYRQRVARAIASASYSTINAGGLLEFY